MRNCTSLVTGQKLLQLQCDILGHPLYSPDLTASAYHLFRSLQHFSDGKMFTSNNEVKHNLEQFFPSNKQTFCERGIMLLTEKRLKVLVQNRLNIYKIIKYLFPIWKLDIFNCNICYFLFLLLLILRQAKKCFLKEFPPVQLQFCQGSQGS